MALSRVRDRVRSAFADLDHQHDVERFLDGVRENQRLMEKRFVGLAWLLLLLVLLFELLSGGAMEDGVTLLGARVPPHTVRDALPAAIAATYMSLVIIGLIRKRQFEVHDLTLAEFRPQLVEQGLHHYMRPASLLQGSTLIDGVTSQRLRWWIGRGPVVMATAMLLGPPVYVATAVLRCAAQPARSASVLWFSAVLAGVFCTYALLVFLAGPRKERPRGPVTAD